MKALVTWKEGTLFAADVPSGGRLEFSSDAGGQAPTPMETLLASAAACTAMDVLAILEKKRQTVTSYELEVEGERPPEGTYPRPFRAIKVVHRLRGPGLDPAAVARAVELSDGKYCSVAATLRDGAAVTSEWVAEDA